MTAPALRAPTSTARAVANTLKGSLGNLVEWYDVYAYSVFQLYFKDSFFAPEDENSDIYVWAGFAVTFLARPVGAWFFGRFADRHGRKASLTLSVTIMALGSLLIAILPTRDAIGLWAAVALMALRLVQGFATGGEYAASATYMSEAATAGKRGFFSSFQYVTLVGGHVLAQATLLIMQSFMTKAELTEWGWRVPFLIGGIAAVVVFWLRRTMDESLAPEYLESVRSGEAKGSGSLAELFRYYWKPMLVCFLFTLGGTVAFYTYSINGPAMVKTIFKDTDPSIANWVNFLSLTVFMLIQPLGGMLSDRIGRKPVFLFFSVLGLGWTYVLITFLPQQTDAWTVFLMMIVSYIILTGYTSINAIFKAELFPAHVRAIGVGLSYGIANSIFAGTAPMLYEWAKKDGNVPLFIVYVTLCILATLITTLVVMRRDRITILDVEQGHADSLDDERAAGLGRPAARA